MGVTQTIFNLIGMLSQVSETTQVKHFRQDPDKEDTRRVVATLTIMSDCTPDLG